MIHKIIIPREHSVTHLLTRCKYDTNSYRVAVSCLQDKLKNCEIEAEIFISNGNYDERISDKETLNKVNISNSCGAIVDIADDYITIKPKNQAMSDLFIFCANNGIIPMAYMRYVGEKSIFKRTSRLFVSKIITFDIVIPRIPNELATPEFNKLIKVLRQYGVTGVNGVVYK